MRAFTFELIGLHFDFYMLFEFFPHVETHPTIMNQSVSPDRCVTRCALAQCTRVRVIETRVHLHIIFGTR